MEQKINDILISLSNEGLYDIKNELIDSLELFISSLEDAAKHIDEKIVQNVYNHNFNDMQKYVAISKNIDSLKENLQEYAIFRENKTFQTKIQIKENEQNLERQKEVLLNEDMSFKYPYKIRIKNKTFTLSKNAWVDLAELVCDILVSFDINKFEEYIEFCNRKKHQSFCFVDGNLNKKDVTKTMYFVKGINKYLQRTGDANSLSNEIHDMLKFFNLDENYGVYVLDKEGYEIKKTKLKENNEININTKIKHNKYGVGRVIKIDEKYVYVKFENKDLEVKSFLIDFIKSNDVIEIQ